jgi:hypothetical protein
MVLSMISWELGRFPLATALAPRGFYEALSVLELPPGLSV